MAPLSEFEQGLIAGVGPEVDGHAAARPDPMAERYADSIAEVGNCQGR